MVEQINSMNGVQPKFFQLFGCNQEVKESENSIFTDSSKSEPKTEPKTETAETPDLNKKVENLKAKLKDSLPKLSDEFLAETVRIAESIQCNSEDLLAIMYHESGGWNPACAAKNKKGQIVYGGLIQMNKNSLRTVSSKYARELGLNPNISMNRFLKLPREEQLKYVNGYFMLMKDSCNLNKEAHLTPGETWGMLKSPNKTKKRDKAFFQKIEAHLNKIKQRIFKKQPANHLNIPKA